MLYFSLNDSRADARPFREKMSQVELNFFSEFNLLVRAFKRHTRKHSAEPVSVQCNISSTYFSSAV